MIKVVDWDTEELGSVPALVQSSSGIQGKSLGPNFFELYRFVSAQLCHICLIKIKVSFAVALYDIKPVYCWLSMNCMSRFLKTVMPKPLTCNVNSILQKF